MQSSFKSSHRRRLPVLTLFVVAAIAGAAFSSGTPTTEATQSNADYQRGRSALDRGDFEEAVSAFEAAASDEAVADAAIYWQAYAQKELGNTADALELIAQLERSYPQSRWVDDARALAVSIRGPSAATSTDDEELKLVALNGLLQVDAEEAIPLLEEFMKGSHSTRLKERALFVAAQSGSDRAHTLLATMARDNSEPELQRKAIRYLGVHNSERSLALLAELYGSVEGEDARAAVLRSFMIAGDKTRLLEVARTEENQELRARAIRLLGTMDAPDEIWTLYQNEASVEVKKKMLQAFMVGDHEQRLLSVARNTSENEELRGAAIRLLGTMDATDTLWPLYSEVGSVELKKKVLHGLFISDDAEHIASVARDTSELQELRLAAVHDLGVMDENGLPYLEEMYPTETSMEIKERILHAFFLQDAVAQLIDVARTESDIELKKKAVHWLSLTDAPEAKAFMLEILRN